MEQRTIEKWKEGARSSTFARILLARLTVMSRYLRRFQTSRKIPRVRALPLMNVVVIIVWPLVAARFPHCSAKNRATHFHVLSSFCLCVYLKCIFEEETKLSRIELTLLKKDFLFFFSFSLSFSLFFKLSLAYWDLYCFDWSINCSCRSVKCQQRRLFTDTSLIQHIKRAKKHFLA